MACNVCSGEGRMGAVAVIVECCLRFKGHESIYCTPAALVSCGILDVGERESTFDRGKREMKPSEFLAYIFFSDFGCSSVR